MDIADSPPEAVWSAVRPETPSSPVFLSVAAAFGLALGELVLAVGQDEDLVIALNHAYLTAKASILADTLRR